MSARVQRIAWVALLSALMSIAMFSRPRIARADQSSAHTASVVVLGFDSDDAEEQADAFTGALRSRVRNSQAWQLVETTQSLGMLTAALRCPGKPPSQDCELRIADQLKVDRYIFGYVTKGPPGQVTAEVHLFQRNKADTVVKESYTDNLKDQNDDFLRKIAQRLLDKISGSAIGVVVVRSDNDNGEVVLDGDKHFPLQSGTAKLELSPGGHSVELAVSGRPPLKRNVVVTAGKETVVDLGAASGAVSETPRGADKPFPMRKAIGAGLAAVGVIGVAIGIINFTAYLDDQKAGKDHEAAPPNPADPKLPEGQTADDVCGKKGNNGIAYIETFTICKANADANRHSLMAGIAGVGGAVLLGAGAYLLLTDGDSAESGKKKATAPSPSPKRLRAMPTFGPGGGGLSVSGVF